MAPGTKFLIPVRNGVKKTLDAPKIVEMSEQ